MSTTYNPTYLFTPTGQLNIAEIACLLGCLISVELTSPLYCELVDNIRSIYPDFNTYTVRSVYQAFTICCSMVTITILTANLFQLNISFGKLINLNRICLVLNIIMGIMMISIGICAAFWEDKLQRTPRVIQRGYLSHKAQYIFNEKTYPNPGAAAAAAVFAILAGICFLLEACTRAMSEFNDKKINPNEYTIPIQYERAPTNEIKRERIIPIERVNPSFKQIQI